MQGWNHHAKIKHALRHYYENNRGIAEDLVKMRNKFSHVRE